MNPHLRLALVFHNHQPIGNFDGTVDDAYLAAYLPLVEALSERPRLRASLHLSGCLFDWLAERRPEYLEAVAKLVHRKQLEIIGGGYYEPILPMIPRRDRRGQLSQYRDALARRFGVAPQGAWLAERVWEQQLVTDLADCGFAYTILDDAHFQRAGLCDEQLSGYYLTEDEGRLLAVFPGNERLRYLMPFAPPEETIAYLRSIAESRPGSTVVFADDGEKFGFWPGTHALCNEQGWLRRFFDLLDAEPWIETTTPGEVCATVEPIGKIYLPDGSYREMHDWASIGAGPSTWRNFLVKYPEAADMHARMLMVSDRLARAEAAEYPAEIVDAARRELFRAQCNCGYWHGTFGGVYLAHLRQAIYRHLIRTDDLLDRTADRPREWVEAVPRDHNLDAQTEVCLTNDKLTAFIAPHDGGRLYELDVRNAARNVTDTASRRVEPYHASADSELSAALGEAAFESRPRRALVDRFYESEPAAGDVAEGRACDIGDFATGRYRFEVRRNASAAGVRMTRIGRVGECSIRVTKTVALAAGESALTCEYLLENLPADRTFHFAVEMNFSPTFERSQTSDLLELRDAAGVRLGFEGSQPTSFWNYPVRTVHRCERGLETTTQAVCVVPHWTVRADAQGRWSVDIRVPIDATAAEQADTGGATHCDLGDTPPQVSFPEPQIITTTEIVREPAAARRKSTRRLKAG